MASFLSDVVNDLEEKHENLSHLTLIVPSKRAGNFLKRALALSTQETIFSPEIIAIEDFVVKLSHLQAINNIDLLFEFYQVYETLTPSKEKESLDQVSRWAQLLLGDFNEIDRYLVEPDKIFNYLGAIKELNHWSFEENQTEATKRYISFWKRLHQYYNALSKRLKEKQKGYQGLIYREAVNQLESFSEENKSKHFVFIGFNALNKAEETIIKHLLDHNLASVYWDIDDEFINNPVHSAGLFTRQYRNSWKHYTSKPFNWVSSHYKSPKNIEVIGVPKQIGQIKYLGSLIDKLSKENNLNNTAVVLGEESLLLPLLNSIPKTIDRVNITMGLPIGKTPLSQLFGLWFKILKNYKNEFYYKDIINLLSNPFVKLLIDTDNAINQIQENNIVYLGYEQLTHLISEEQRTHLHLIFGTTESNPKSIIETCITLIWRLKDVLDEDKENNNIELESLFRFYTLFNELKHLSKNTNYLDSFNILQGLYNELIQSESLDFKGDPYNGLQIMGMLETRVLDFDTVIISSVNEGILPAGKTANSFIPFDVKLQYFMPTYKEKDAVYTYHFYRLIQRAKNVYIIYDTEVDTLNGGEPSRFIKQLEVEGIHAIKKRVMAPKVPSDIKKTKQIEKSSSIMEDLSKLAQKGFSPSTLTNYIRNPIDFYHEKLLGIKTYNEVEETLASNTLGNIIHKTLEELYLPYRGATLSTDIIKSMHPKIDELITKYFKIEYRQGDFSKGKNLIIYEVAKQYIKNFLSKEIEDLEQGNTIEIIDLEKSIEANIEVSGLNHSVKIRGIVDRVDRYNGTVRIIDYKSGKVDQSKVEIINWEDINMDYDKYSKSFQVLTYALMLFKNKDFPLPLEGGIISFKNLNKGFLKFAKKDKPGAYANKETLITEETLANFEQQLQGLIQEIFNPEIAFIEKEL